MSYLGPHGQRVSAERENVSELDALGKPGKEQRKSKWQAAVPFLRGVRHPSREESRCPSASPALLQPVLVGEWWADAIRSKWGTLLASSPGQVLPSQLPQHLEGAEPVQLVSHGPLGTTATADALLKGGS